MKVLRNELKYYITYAEYQKIRLVLKDVLKLDDYSKNGPYFIRSLYFDTEFNKAFYEKMFGLGERKKYRLRIYHLDAQQVKFEIKNKVKDQIFKETAIISRKNAMCVIKGEIECLLSYNNTILNKIYCDFKKNQFKPVAIIDYKREAFMDELNKIRVTFDQDLSRDENQLELFNNVNTQNLLKEGQVIMEIKYNKYLPEIVRDLLSSIRSTRSAISKYCMGREISQQQWQRP